MLTLSPSTDDIVVKLAKTTVSRREKEEFLECVGIFKFVSHKSFIKAK